MNKNHSRWSWTVVLIFLLLAGMTRFYRLDWSFWWDEAYSYASARSLVERPFFPSKWEKADYLGRVVPVGVFLQALTYKVFGTSEVGSRIGVAIAGTLAIPLCVLLTFYLYGQLTGIILGFMLVLSPWHLLMSQYDRIYAFAFLFGSITLLTAALAWKHNSAKWAAFSGIVSAIAVSTHNFTIAIPIGLATFALFEWVRRKTPLPWRAILGYTLFGVPLLLVSLSLALIGLSHWVGGKVAGYTSIHMFMALAFNLNWGIALFACAGWVWALWCSRESLDRMWASVATVVAFLAILVPLFWFFHHRYLFAFSLPFFMLAARIIAQIYEGLKERSLVLAIVVVMAFLLLPLPSFVSYYQDGDRPDTRAAAKFIAAHYQTGDIIASSGSHVLHLYLPQARKVRELDQGPEVISQLERLTSSGKRLWLVCILARQEPHPDVDRWLWKNAVRMLRIKKKRFDYHENITDVYLVKGSKADQANEGNYNGLEFSDRYLRRER